MRQVDLTRLKIRTISRADLPAIVEIDARASGRPRPDYYQAKLDRATDSARQLVVSLAAEYEGRVVGFMIGEAYMGEFGIPETTASIDTVGVDPALRQAGVARALMEEFVTTARKAGIERVQTLVHWNDHDLLRFFDSMGFTPARTLNLERAL